jgi:4-carboxymuconolactone decarboxylase
MTARLPSLIKDQLDPAQLALYESIVSGPRAAGPQHFALVDSSGALTGPFGIMLHQPAVGGPLQQLGAAIRYGTSLSDRIREIAILSVAAATGSAFERYAHERVGRSVGLSDDELNQLAHGHFVTDDPAEAAAYRLCGILNGDQLPVTDAEFSDLHDVLGIPAVIEIVVLQGYYTTLAQLLAVFDVGVPADVEASQ